MDSLLLIMLLEAIVGCRQTVTLVTGRNTRIRDQFGNNIGIRNLREGMVVDARFSCNDKEHPTQSNAFSITVVKQNHTSIIAVGRVLRTGYEGRYGFILTGNANNINSQTKYIISNETYSESTRKQNPFRAIRPGQEVERAPFQTLSIPPQTSALTYRLYNCRAPRRRIQNPETIRYVGFRVLLHSHGHPSLGHGSFGPATAIHLGLVAG